MVWELIFQQPKSSFAGRDRGPRESVTMCKDVRNRTRSRGSGFICWDLEPGRLVAFCRSCFADLGQGGKARQAEQTEQTEPGGKARVRLIVICRYSGYLDANGG
jgi:hypothetical protein